MSRQISYERKPLKESMEIYHHSAYYDGKSIFESNVEVPFNELSGDENDEKQCGKSMINSTYYHHTNNKKQSLFFGSVTVMKTIVGSGILGLPAVMKAFGIGLGSTLFIMVFFLNQYTCQILLKAKNLSRRSNFCTLGLVSIGKSAKYIINAVVITNNIGICMAEMVIFGSTATALFEVIQPGITENWYASQQFLTLCSAVLICPLSFVKSIDKLKHVALFAIASIFLFSIATIVTLVDEYQYEGHDHNGSYFGIPPETTVIDCLKNFPNLLLSFGYQFNFFPIYKSIKDPSDRRGSIVSFLGLLASLFLYLIVGVAGYMAYGNTVEVNYLESLQRDHIGTFLFVLLNISFVISTTLSFPVIFFGARNNVFSIVSDILKKCEEKKSQKIQRQVSLNEQDKEKSQLLLSKKSIKINNDNSSISGFKFYLITSIMFVIVVAVAILVGDIGPIFNVVGSIDAVAISYVLPCGFYLRLSKKKKNVHYVASFIIFVTASILSVTCLVSNYL